MNQGQVKGQGYENQVIGANQRGHLHHRGKRRNYHVKAAWTVENVDDENERRIPERQNSGYDVGHQHAGQDEVGFCPESGRQSDGGQREPVSAQVEYVQSEEDGHPQNDRNHYQWPGTSWSRSRVLSHCGVVNTVATWCLTRHRLQ